MKLCFLIMCTTLHCSPVHYFRNYVRTNAAFGGLCEASGGFLALFAIFCSSKHSGTSCVELSNFASANNGLGKSKEKRSSSNQLKWISFDLLDSARNTAPSRKISKKKILHPNLFFRFLIFFRTFFRYEG